MYSKVNAVESGYWPLYRYNPEKALPRQQVVDGCTYIHCSSCFGYPKITVEDPSFKIAVNQKQNYNGDYR